MAALLNKYKGPNQTQGGGIGVPTGHEHHSADIMGNIPGSALHKLQPQRAWSGEEGME